MASLSSLGDGVLSCASASDTCSEACSRSCEGRAVSEGAAARLECRPELWAPLPSSISVFARSCTGGANEG